MQMGKAKGAQQAQAQAQQQQLQQQQAQLAQQQAAASAPAAPVAPSGPDITAEMQKLADLHKSGVLTDQEFAAAKQKLLS
jgi:type II secretory pathway pseudopilin PulG